MADDDAKAESKGPGGTADAAILQIREVVKWLIAAFAAVGGLLIAGSQLAEIGQLTGWRLAAAIAAIFLVLLGVAVAILEAVRVFIPLPLGLKDVAEGKDLERIRSKIAADPSLMHWQAASVPELRARQEALLKDETEAWQIFKRDENDKEALRLAERASADRVVVQEAVTSVVAFARYTLASELFKRSLRGMLAGATIAALAIALFAWAAHPEDKDDEETAPVVAKVPTSIVVNLSPAGEDALGEKLGAGCDANAVPAVALGGEADALEVVTVPSDTCSLQRFTLTETLGVATSTEAATE